MRKKQDPKKRAQDEFDKRQQHRLNRPLHGPKKKSSVQIEFEKYRKLQDQIDFSQKSPEFGQNKAWVEIGRAHV